MDDKALLEFKYSLKGYLSTLDIGNLRAYGRNVGVFNPTKKKKDDLIEDIILILSGQLAPSKPSKLGAPVKSNFVDPKIIEVIEGYCTKYLMSFLVDPAENVEELLKRDVLSEMRAMQAQKEEMSMQSPEFSECEEYQKKRQMHTGQLSTLNGVAMLLPVNCIDNSIQLIMPVSLIKKYDLREGDIVSCYAVKNNVAHIITDILTINGIDEGSMRRGHFDAGDVCIPQKRLRFCRENGDDTVTAKYLDWLIPLGAGQRACVVSAPKAGKTSVLFKIAKTVQICNNVKVLVLLIDQSPEIVSTYRKIIDAENLIYSTYDDEADRQVFAAEFILNRAKRLVECGQNVLLIVDSLTALAHAYNDTEASAGGKMLVGGLESKTLQFIKKYFGAARCFTNNSSLTIVGAISTETGNPADDIIAADVVSIASAEIRLDGALAAKRIYPAIDLQKTCVKDGEKLQTNDEIKFDYVLRNAFLAKYGVAELNELLAASNEYVVFQQKIKKQI